MSIPVIDLFAGPGGLGEGFSRESSVRFEIAVSIEKDRMAHETLRLRAAHRWLTRNTSTTSDTWNQWDSILAREPWNTAFPELSSKGDALIRAACSAADHEALNLELGPDVRTHASQEIRARLQPYVRGNELPTNSVLIGGPPCQAYSIVGRSRNKGKTGYSAEEDHRHFLYLEYLQVIAEFQPAVFVMENVKGILTSKVHESRIFHTIMRDLERPGQATSIANDVEYVLLPLQDPSGLLGNAAPSDFIIKAENFGVPQARHRVIILGVRKDVFDRARIPASLTPSRSPSVWDVISDLPALRPQLSFRGGGLEWHNALEDPLLALTLRELRKTRNEVDSRIAQRISDVRETVRQQDSDPGSGSDRLALKAVAAARQPNTLRSWYRDRPLNLLANHESRAHMPSDLVRYLFVAAFGEITGTSPRLSDFPRCLLPDHKNVNRGNVDDSIFKDRFRVQVAGRHSMTITSHIAKDGHAFIHPDPMQFRSLTVREAARLQTFPDSYVFLGNRTSQYTQVGNAVPPYLANQIARVVADLLGRAGMVQAKGIEMQQMVATV